MVWALTWVLIAYRKAGCYNRERRRVSGHHVLRGKCHAETFAHEQKQNAETMRTLFVDVTSTFTMASHINLFLVHICTQHTTCFISVYSVAWVCGVLLMMSIEMEFLRWMSKYAVFVFQNKNYRFFSEALALFPPRHASVAKNMSICLTKPFDLGLRRRVCPCAVGKGFNWFRKEFYLLEPLQTYLLKAPAMPPR